ncbi:MAG: hypothetical protein IJE07_13335 [Clostridia bacterium]|nr:hypothetical protein [Clostridia bacterium]
MRKFVCLLGMLLSIALIGLGVYNLMEGVTYLKSDFTLTEANYSGNSASDSSFGADFYTYSYRATRYAANNVNALGNYVEKIVFAAATLGPAVLGLAGLLLSIYGFFAAGVSSKQLKCLRQIAEGLDRNAGKQEELLRQILSDETNSASKQQELLTRLIDDQNTGAATRQQLLQRIADKEVTVVAAPAPASAQPETSYARPKAPEVTKPAATKPAEPKAEAPKAPVSPMTWNCSLCGHANMMHLDSCDMCGNARDGKRPDLQKPTAAAKRWTCQICGTENEAGAEHCIICGEKRA